MRQNVLILVHSGTYKAEFLVIDSNVTILGAGEYFSLCARSIWSDVERRRVSGTMYRFEELNL